MEKKERKVKARKVGSLELVKCSECRNGIKLSDTLVFCNRRMEIKYCNQTCSEGVKGEAVLYEEDLEKIIDIYMSNKDMIEFLKETNEAIKRLLLKEIVSRSEIIGKYRVTITEFTRKTLDVEKAKKKLEELGILDKYLKEKKIVYPKIRPL